MTGLDERARFEQLWRAHYHDVFAFALRRLADEHAAADVAAETFGVAWRRLEAVPGESRPWLFGVARKVMANERRGERRRAALQAKLQTTAVAWSVERPTEGALTPVADAFNRLGDCDRETLALIVWEELRPREAARVLGISPARFSVRLHRARQRLRKELSRSGHERVDASADAALDGVSSPEVRMETR